jgi:AcrR family transcriptional regulator
MDSRNEFPISELVTRTGVPRATIHHYLARGVLPQPRKVATNRFLYQDRHVHALRLIKLLRERRHLPLNVIGEVLPDLMGMRGEQAFRPEMWDQAVGLHLRESSRTAPASRLVQVATTAFSRHGYENVNVDDLCRAAGVAKGSFYRYYNSKEELFFATASHAAVEVGKSFGELKARRGASSTEDLAEVLAAALEPRLPLLLELWSRALQKRPGHAAVADQVFAALREEVGRHLDQDDPQQKSEAVVLQAIFAVWSRMLSSATSSRTVESVPPA